MQRELVGGLGSDLATPVARRTIVALSQQNWVIASEELFRRIPTYQNGTQNTLNGPPTGGAWNVGDFWRDQNGAEFVCTGAGTPGT